MATENDPAATTATLGNSSNYRALAKFEEMKTEEGITLDKLKAFVLSSILQRERDPSKALLSSTKEVSLLLSALLHYGIEKDSLSV